MNEISDSVKPGKKTATATPIKPQKNGDFVWVEDFCKQPSETSWLIRTYLELDSLVSIFGDSQAGKSFVAIDMSCHIAHGMKWCGRKVKQGVVLYIAGEGQHGLKRRLQAWHEFHGLPKKNIAIRTVPVKLCDPTHTADLIKKIREFLVDVKPALIVIDTLNRNWGVSASENETGAMTAFVDGMSELRGATGACVLTVHHVGHSDKSRGRGSIALYDGIDFEYRIERSGNPDMVNTLKTTLTPTKWKDSGMPEPLQFAWNLQDTMWLEQDDDDNLTPVYSIVLTPETFTKNQGDVLCGRPKAALDILKGLYDEQVNNLVAGGFDLDKAREQAWVSPADWATAMTTAMKAVVSDSGNRATLRTNLIKSGLVIKSNDYIKPA